MDNIKLSPELIKIHVNDELSQCENDVKNYMVKGSPEERRFQMKLRLLKKLNENEYNETQKYKRTNSRFS